MNNLIIDSHSHVTFPVSKHIQLMDDLGINKTILFSTLIHPEKAIKLNSFKQEMEALNQILNNNVNSINARKNSMKELVEVINQYPDKYIGFGSVPLGLEVEETKKWIKEYIVANNLKGVGEFTLGSGQIAFLKPIFEALKEFKGLSIWIHTFAPMQLDDIVELIGLAKQYPEIPVIFGHLGGINWLQTIELVKNTPNAYIDTSAFYTTFALTLAMNEIPDRTIFGADYPYGDPYITIEAIKRYAPNAEVERKVLGENFRKLLDNIA